VEDSDDRRSLTSAFGGRGRSDVRFLLARRAH